MLSSCDRGASWQIGTGAKVATTESQLVELEDGVLMMNCRDDRGGSRSVYTTNDLGKSWILHPTSRQALIEPTCMASLLRIDHDKFGRLLVFSNPNSRTGRFNMTLKVSEDDGQSWPVKWHTLYDQRVGAGYSCLTRIDKDHIGVVYEGIRELYYLRFTIRELLGT
jgi:sialidase-1